MSRHCDVLANITMQTARSRVSQNPSVIVIQGISNYADSHRNERWQPCAAAAAAACAKEILSITPLAEVIKASPVNEAIEGKDG